MKNVAAESALIRNADTLSRETSHFTPRGLIDAARAELRSERPDGAMMQSVDRLIARGFVRPSAQFEGYLKTDHTDRQIDAFTKMLTNPTPTNPRVSALQLLDGGRDRSNPMHQAQRYSIVDASARGGVQASLEQILSAADRERAVFVHGERGPDVARFAIGTDNLHNARDFLHSTRAALATHSPASLGYGPLTTLIVSDAAVRSSHRAELIGRIADAMGVGKVLFLVEPDQTPPHELAPLAHAVRAGAVSEVVVGDAFRREAETGSAAAPLHAASDVLRAVRGETLEMAAARLGAAEAVRTGSPVQLVAGDPLRLANLNLAARAVAAAQRSIAGQGEGPCLTIESFTAMAAQDYDRTTGAGMRMHDVLQVRAAPEPSGYKVGDRYVIRDVNPIDSRVLVKDAASDYVRLPLAAMDRQQVRFDILTRSQIQIGDGDPVSMLTAGAQRVGCIVRDLSEKQFSLALPDGRIASMTPDTAKASDLQPAFAVAAPDLSKPSAIIAVAGIHDRASDGAFTAGAALMAARAHQSGLTGPLMIMTSDPAKFLDNAERSSVNDTMVQQQSFERALADVQPMRGDAGRGDVAR